MEKGSVEYWLARDLQHLLGYSKWDNFLNVVSKGKTACEMSARAVADHFADVSKMVDLGSGSQREADDIMLTRTESTIFNSRERGLDSESAISHEHVTNNEAVRKTLLERGIRPERLPVADDVKKVERRLASEKKKSLKNPGALDS